MDLWDMLLVALRRWRILVPLLLLTVSLALFSGGVINPEYSASGALLLVGPNQTSVAAPAEEGQANSGQTVAQPINPYLSFSGSLPITGQALMLRLNSARTKEALIADGLATTYEVDMHNRVPIMVFTVNDGDSRTAVNTLNRLIDIAGEDLISLQSERGAPENQRIGIDVLNQSTTGIADNSTATRVRLMIIGLGVAGSIVTAFAADGVINWREKRRKAERLRVGAAADRYVASTGGGVGGGATVGGGVGGGARHGRGEPGWRNDGGRDGGRGRARGGSGPRGGEGRAGDSRRGGDDQGGHEVAGPPEAGNGPTWGPPVPGDRVPGDQPAGVPGPNHRYR